MFESQFGKSPSVVGLPDLEASPPPEPLSRRAGATPISVLDRLIGEDLLPRAGRFAADPRFVSARAIYAETLARLHKGNGVTRFLVNETARALITNICIYLDTYFDYDDPRSGLTMRKMQRICAARGVASPGRVFAFLKMLELAGYLTSVSAADRRVKFLRPTAKLWAYRAHLMGAILAAADEIEPAKGYAYAKICDDRDLDVRLLRVSGKDFFDGVLLLNWHPGIAMFADRDGGYQFLLRMLGEARLFASPREFRPEFEMSLLKESLRSGLSRSHLRSILAQAERRGLLEVRAGSNQRIELKPKLIAEFDEHVALLLVYYADIVDRRLGEPCPVPFGDAR